MRWWVFLLGGAVWACAFVGMFSIIHHCASAQLDVTVEAPEAELEIGEPEVELPPMPARRDLGPADPEETETPGQMHMRQAMESLDHGWCENFCARMGAGQLHPDAFRNRLRGELAMYAEMDSWEGDGHPLRDHEDETYQEFTERVAVGVESRFGDEPICACEHGTAPLANHWVLVVPRERAFFVSEE